MNPLDASSIITATGLIGIFVVLVAETGLLVGCFLPGDSLLFSAGLLAASQGPAVVGPAEWFRFVIVVAGELDDLLGEVLPTVKLAAP